MKRSKKGYIFVKRILDILFSMIGLLFLIPIVIIVGMLIKIDSKGKIIFKHKRIGQYGKIIYIYKFRTMVGNAENMIENFTQEQKEEFEKNYKLQNDPRITKVGKILRKLSLDELPQIINILKGDLSIIGPRPVVKNELEKYKNNKEKFLSVKPGLTGYWQANGRSAINYEQRMEMELYYVDNMSLFLDIKIIFKTITAVFSREGAM